MTDVPASLDPRRTALLVMDVQPGIVSRLEAPEALLARVREAVSVARRRGVQVGYVRVAFEDADMEAMPPTARMAARVLPNRDAFHAGSAATQVHPDVAPEPGDIVVRKTRVGAFSTTDLDAQLRERGIDTLVLAGISTSGVVLSTVRDAHDRDYHVLVLADATADPDPEVHEFLIERVLSRQADVIGVEALARLLG